MNDPGLRSLAIARVTLGAIFIVRTTPLANLYPSPLAHVDAPLLGWPVHDWHAVWLGLALPSAAVAALCVLRTAAAVLFLFGIATRPAGVIASTSALVVMAQDTFSFSFTRYILFLGTGLVALCDGGAAIALRPSRPEHPRAGLGVVQAFVASIYAWSAVAKLRPAWLSGRTLAALHEGHFLRGPLADFALSSAPLRAGSAVGIVILELALGALLLARRTRLVGVAAALAMHAIYEVVAQPDVMGLVMAALLCSFLPVGARNQFEARCGRA
jgi:hypothetical protein